MSTPPARPRSYPPARARQSGVDSTPPPSGKRPISSIPPRHEDLQGAAGVAVRFRPERLSVGELRADLACQFVCEGLSLGPLRVLDLSAAGFSAALDPEVGIELAPGSVLESCTLLLRGQAVWGGEAVIVHSSIERIGARFTTGALDLNHLRLGATLESRLSLRREQTTLLPPEWRAAVADLYQLLEHARQEVEQFELSESHDPLDRPNEEARLFERLRSRWGTEFYAAASELHAMSKGFNWRVAALGRSYASAILAPLMLACPMHRRAYEKPLGYAGDFRTIELCFARQLTGEGLFGRFLQHVAQHYTLTQSVLAREVVMREAVRAALESEGEGTVRVMALAAGGAVELRRVLAEVGNLTRPAHLILLDQEPAAHESAHRHITRVLLDRHHGTLPVTVECLQFSVRQLIRPQGDDELRVVNETLADLDLIYSAGLYDYLPDAIATALTRAVYDRLRPGGRLLLGNLVETPDSTWIFEYVLNWSLIYRTEESMLRLARGVTPQPAHTGITLDATGRCIFLDVTRSLWE
jgi:extracellular factor (EF) 3-hydroxypalmitic acid methyl ester biosynthesis protein